MSEEWADVISSRENNIPRKANNVSKKERAVRLTHRTIESLRNKRKEKKLDKAYEKYNENYKKMRKAANIVDRVQQQQRDGQEVRVYEAEAAGLKAVKYAKKLSKLAITLLEDDIKSIAARKHAVPRRVKLGARFMERIRIVSKTKKARKEETKKIEKETKDNIITSVDKAIFKGPLTGEVRPKIDKQVIKDLSLQKGEDELSTLREFIKADNKNVAKSKTVEKPKENDANSKADEKKNQSISEDSLRKIAGLSGNSNENSQEKQENPSVDENDLRNAAGINNEANNKTAEKTDSAKKDTRNSEDSLIANLEEIRRSASPELAAQIDKYIAASQRSTDKIDRQNDDSQNSKSNVTTTSSTNEPSTTFVAPPIETSTEVTPDAIAKLAERLKKAETDNRNLKEKETKMAEEAKSIQSANEQLNKVYSEMLAAVSKKEEENKDFSLRLVGEEKKLADQKRALEDYKNTLLSMKNAQGAASVSDEASNKGQAK